MAAKIRAWSAVALFLTLLTGCASPCRLTVSYQGDLHKPIEMYAFQPGVACIY